MEITMELLKAILDSYVYEIVFADCHHVVQYMNKAAIKRYSGRVEIGQSLFNCHNEGSKAKIEQFLERAEAGEEEMFEVVNGTTGEREFFVPVKNKSGEIIGYFERHEVDWKADNPSQAVGDYWLNRVI